MKTESKRLPKFKVLKRKGKDIETVCSDDLTLRVGDLYEGGVITEFFTNNDHVWANLKPAPLNINGTPLRTIDELDADEAIHCPTYEEWLDILKLNPLNTIKTNFWDFHKDNTLYFPYMLGGEGGVSSIIHHSNSEQNFYPASDFLPQEEKSPNYLPLEPNYLPPPSSREWLLAVGIDPDKFVETVQKEFLEKMGIEPTPQPEDSSDAEKTFWEMTNTANPALDQHIETQLNHADFETLLDAFLADFRDFLLKKDKEYGSLYLNPLNVLVDLTPRQRILSRIEEKIGRIVVGKCTDKDSLLDLMGLIIHLEVIERAENTQNQ